MNIRKLTVLFLPLASAIIISSCSNRPDVSGTWAGTPVKIDNISAACDANATMSISFNNSGNQKDNGTVTISALIDANQPVVSPDNAVDQAYEVSVAATALISGQWSFEYDDDDDIILTLDPQTLQVNVDPDGVTFTENVLTSAQQPRLDSLTTATAAAWKRSITKAMKQQFFALQKISDVKIHNGIMSCEINDRDLTFRKTE